MLMYRAFTLVAVTAALAIVLTGRTPHAVAQEPSRQGELLQPGMPYPGAAEAPIKLIPPGEIKHRTTTTHIATHEPVTTVAPPVKASPPPKRIVEKTPSTPPAMIPPMQEKLVQTPATFTAQPLTASAAAPQTTEPHGIPFALTPTSPDIVVGSHNRAPGLRPSPSAPSPSPAALKPVPVKTAPQESISAPSVSESRVLPRDSEIRTKTRSASLEPTLMPPASRPPAALMPEPENHVAQPKPQLQDHTGLSKRSQVLFAEGAVDPGPDTVTDLRRLAPDLTAALKGTGRVRLEAFGGPPGDKSSDARRLSLKRALTVRALLIENGVPAERIDVRALGGADDGGAPDRVDVFLHAS